MQQTNSSNFSSKQQTNSGNFGNRKSYVNMRDLILSKSLGIFGLFRTVRFYSPKFYEEWLTKASGTYIYDTDDVFVKGDMYF